MKATILFVSCVYAVANELVLSPGYNSLRTTDDMVLKKHGDYYYTLMYSPDHNRTFAMVPGISDGTTVITPFSDEVENSETPFEPPLKPLSEYDELWYDSVYQCAQNKERCTSLQMDIGYNVSETDYFGVSNFLAVYQHPGDGSKNVLVLGMGHPYISDYKVRLLDQTTVETFASALSILHKPRYPRFEDLVGISFSFKDKAHSSVDDAGVISLGPPRKDLYTGKLHEFNFALTRDDIPGRVVLPLKNIALGDKKLLPFKLTAYSAYLDSTVTSLYLPKDLYGHFIENLGPVLCDTTGDLTFSFGHLFRTKIDAKMSNMVIPSNGACKLNVVPTDGKDVVIGTDALAYFFVHYSIDFESLFLAQSA